ncbi:MAG TPA: multidrug DMT transporter permease [Vicinamibacteria bacterium]|nr:multidrug DMT transporter permease [Vicinamibacteria bacterium]
MLIVDSYAVAVVLCVVTMLCWGSWANTLKLASKEWPFPLYYWDYAAGLVLTSLALGLTIGSLGAEGRGFVADLRQASGYALLSSFLGGVVFNIANLLVVAAIDIAGLAVAFPVAIGLALVVGVVVNYLATPVGSPVLLFGGVALVVAAILVDARAYARLPSAKGATGKGLFLSVLAGLLMGFFYRFVAAAMITDFRSPQPGRLTPYSALFIFTFGVLVSNFLWNTFFMYRPVRGAATTYAEYVTRGSPRLHLVGILGGFIWCLGMAMSLIASERAGFAISYGLGQGATMVAAAWGVFVWKEFRGAPPATDRLIAAMFVLFIAGLATIIAARLA